MKTTLKKNLFFLTLSFLVTSCFQPDKEGFEDNRAPQNLKAKYFPDSSFQQIIQLNSGYLNGIDISFWKNGKIKNYGYGKGGKLSGYWFLYDTSGSLITKQFFKDGKLLFVTDPLGEFIFDNTTLRLISKKKDLDFSQDSDVIKSHFTHLMLNSVSRDTIVFETTKRQFLLNRSLTIIGSKELDYKKRIYDN